MRQTFIILIAFILTYTLNVKSQYLEVKEGKSAIVKVAPSGDAEQFPDRLPAGTQVKKMGEVSRYYDILIEDGRRGWSYKGYYNEIAESDFEDHQIVSVVNEQSLLTRSDVLKIIIVDVEVGDATVIICPMENGGRDVLVIDTGENDSERIKNILVENGIGVSAKPIDRLYITHYDYDHFGDAPALVPLSERIYDHGHTNIKDTKSMRSYLNSLDEPGVDNRTITLEYAETFSGGVEVECVAVNNATDFNPQRQPSTASDNDNSIALIISYNNFDYFTAGDLTFEPEKSLATGIRNCDVYHADHHGSKSTSSHIDFVTKLDPEVSIASNGTKHGHPTDEVAQRLIGIGSLFLQTNFNPDSRAHQPDPKYVADDTYNEENEQEELEAALGTITIVIDPITKKYYIIMPGLSLSESAFDIEQ